MKLVSGNIVCSNDPNYDFIEFDNKFYTIKPLIDENDIEGGKGGNSNVFKLIDPEKEEDDDYDILKFCKYSINTEDEIEKTRIERFKNEIRALKKAKEATCNEVIEIKFNDAKEIGNQEFLYYVMERGEMDMLEYMMTNEIGNQQKIVLCLSILNGISQLHKLDIYHRDIKPDNIFFINGIPKVGDLGLVGYRDDDQSLDTIREKIGPSGWLSPEAVNKMLCEGTNYQNIHCCSIKEYSDIFQLAKLIWYIFEGTAPIGQVNLNDFRLQNEDIFKLLTRMLQFSKDNRPALDYVINQFELQTGTYNA